MAMMIKVHAGDWGKMYAGIGPGWTGRDRIILSKGLFQENDTYFLDTDIASVEVATEKKVKRLAGTAGWGLAGGALLGPVGLLAGLLLGGKKTEVTFVCVFNDGRKILATTDQKTFKKFQLAVLKNEVNDERGEDDQAKGDTVELIAKLGELHDSGVLTAEEFETKKAKLLEEL